MRYGHFDDERREYVITRPGHAPALDQLPGQRGVLRAPLEHRGWLLVRPRRTAAAADPLPLQQRPARRGWPLPVRARRRQRRLLEPGLAADATRPGRLCLSPRAGLHGHQRRAGRHPRRDHLPGAARRDRRGVAGVGHQRATGDALVSRSSAPSSSASGTRRTTPPTSSATCPPARCTSRTGSSTTSPSIGSAVTTSPGSRAQLPVTGFETSREAFLGAYRGWDRPAAVERGAMSGSIAHGWQPVGALRAALELGARAVARRDVRAGLHGEPAGRQVRAARLRASGHAPAREQ